MNKIIIQLICEDQLGIIAQLSSTILDSNSNILSIEQHVDKSKNKFYVRLLVDIEKINIDYNSLENKLFEINNKLGGEIKVFNAEKKLKIAIFATKEAEPVYDILIKNQSKELNCDIPVIISNHSELSNISGQFKINYEKISSKQNAGKLEKILKNYSIDLIVLARFMQIIPPEIVDMYKNKIINIHHGFLPAFKGAKAYHQALEKGVKMIGATSHYVINKLDEGPIICQDVIPINHTFSINQIIESGRQIEKNVLYKAVKAHIEHKIIVYNNKTIVFN